MALIVRWADGPWPPMGEDISVVSARLLKSVGLCSEHEALRCLMWPVVAQMCELLQMPKPSSSEIMFDDPADGRDFFSQALLALAKTSASAGESAARAARAYSA